MGKKKPESISAWTLEVNDKGQLVVVSLDRTTSLSLEHLADHGDGNDNIHLTLTVELGKTLVGLSRSVPERKELSDVLTDLQAFLKGRTVGRLIACATCTVCNPGKAVPKKPKSPNPPKTPKTPKPSKPRKP